MTKTLKFLTVLAALTLASPALAQQVGPPGSGGDTGAETFYVHFYWFESEAGGILNSAPFTYADGTSLCGDEVMSVLFVVPEEGRTFGADEVPFSINADGSVALGDGVKRTVWGALGNAGLCDGVAIDSAKPGYPVGTWASGILSVVFAWPHGEEAVGNPESCYVYLVTFDTQAWDSVTNTSVSVNVNKGQTVDGPYTRSLPSRVTGWGATQCAYVTVAEPTPGLPSYGTSAEVAVGLSDEAYGALTQVPTFGHYLNGRVAATLERPTVESWTVNGAELSGEALKAALKPVISEMSATEIADDEGVKHPGFTFALTPAQVADLTTYTLYTATDLKGPWQSFDELLKEKPLAIAKGMRYTTLRIDEEESVLMTVPRLEEDPTRFYRLQGEVEVVAPRQQGE